MRHKRTRLIVRFDAGYANVLHIRGHGGSLRWDKGIALKNVAHDIWLWETKTPSTAFEFKLLLNDQKFESGPNRLIQWGCELLHTPRFR